MPDDTQDGQNPSSPPQPGDYFAPLARHFLTQFRAPGLALRRYPVDIGGPVPPTAAVQALSEAVFGKGLPVGVKEIVGNPTEYQRTHPVDVTDPSVDPGDVELTDAEKVIRKLRRVGRQVHGAAFKGATTGIGVQQNILLGEVTPPRDAADKVIDFLAPLLAGGAVFGLAGLAGGVAGIGAPSAFGAESVLGKAIEPAIGGAVASRIAGGGVGGAIASEAIKPAITTGVGLLEDVLIGGGYGVGELALAEKAGEVTPEQADEARKSALLYGALTGLGVGVGVRGLGLGFRAIFSPRTSIGAYHDVANAAHSIEAGAPSLAPVGVQVGDEVAGHVATAEREGGKFVWRKGNKFSKGPTPEELRQFYFEKAQRASAGGGVATPPEVAQAELQKVTPENPETLPQDIQSKMSDIGVIAANYYVDRIPTVLNKYTPEQINAELLATKQVMVDPTLPLPVRTTAAGRILALEHALKLSHGTPTGLLPFEMEVAATQMVRDLKPSVGLEGIRRQAAHIRVDGQPELAGRIEQLAQMEDWPNKYHDEVRSRLRLVSKTQSRGFKTGDVALWQGRVVRLLDDPQYGIVHAAPMGKGVGSPQLANVTDLTPIPKVGQYVRLRTGRVIKVTAMRPETFEFKSERWYSIGDIDRVAASKADLLGEVKVQAAAAVRDEPGSHIQIPPVVAATTAGEPVTVLSVGPKEATVRTKSGRVETVPRESVVQASTTPAEAGHPSVMVPGTIPEPQRRILFMAVPRGREAAFQAAIEQGKITPDVLLHTFEDGRKTTVHVLPPYAYNEQTVLYGVEIPADRLPKSQYSALANKAVQALGGQGTVDHYLSPVDISLDALNKDVKFFRVSDEMHANTQRPEDFIPTDQAEHTAYLRHLIAMNEEMDTEVMTPIRAASVAATEVNAAVKGQSGLEALEASQRATASLNQAVDAAADVSIKEASRSVALVPADPETTAAVQAFEREGLTPETAHTWINMLKNMDISSNLVDREILVLFNRNPDIRLFVRKMLEAGAVRTSAGNVIPVIDVIYEATPITREGQILKQARQRFTSAEDLTRYAGENDYIASATSLYTAEYGSPRKPSLVGTIRPTARARVEAAIEERNLNSPEKVVPPSEETYSTKDVATTPGAKRVMAMLGEMYEHDDTGMRGIKQVDHGLFDSVEAAEKWLSDNGLTRRERPADYTFATDFATLPETDKLASLDEDTMYKLHDMLQVKLRVMRIIQRRQWPEGVVEYAQEFGKQFYQRFHEPPFNRNMRLDLGIPVTADLGPSTPNFSNTMVSKMDYAPVVEDKFEQNWSQPGDAVVEDIGPTMHLSNKGGAVVPRDYNYLYTQLLDHDEPPSWKLLETAKKVDDGLKQQTAWTRAKAITDGHGPSPERAQFGPRNIAVAKYKPTGQTVEIVDVPATGDEVTVRFPDQTEMKLSRDDLALPGGGVHGPARPFISGDATPEEAARAVNTAKATQASETMARTERGTMGGDTNNFRERYEMADWVQSGKYADVFKREPPIGFGKVEQDLGVLGADRDVVVSAIATRAAEITNGLRLTKSGGLTGSPKDISELLRIYARSLWLDQILEVKKGEFRPKGLSRTVPTIEVVKANRASDHVIKAIKSVDPALVKPFRLAVYHTIKDQLGGTPFADLQARATAGVGLSKQTEAILRGWGDEIGLAKEVPLGRVAAELMERRLIDPNGQALMAILNKNAGHFKWMKDIGDPPAGTLKLKIPSTRDIWFESSFSIPWKVMRRHPLSRLVGDLVYLAQEKQFIMERGVRDLHTVLRNRYSHEDLKYLKSLKDTHSNWDAAAKAGVEDRWRWGFERLTEFFDEKRDELIRQFLRREITPIEFNPDNPGHRELAIELGLDPLEIRKGALVLPKHPDLVYKYSGLDVTGERPHHYWTADRIEQFMQLKANHPDALSLPTETPEEMRRVFDFWKKWGRSNYWPLIHEGNLAIKVEMPNGGTQVVGFAQTLPDAVEAIRQLRADNRISATDMSSIHIEETKQKIVDDIIQRSVPTSQFREVTSMLSDQMKMGPEEIHGLLLRSDQPQEFIAMPKQVHAKPRIANLKPPFDEPLRELAVYSARIARMDYYWNVIQAFNTMKDVGLDKALSEAYQVPMLQEMGNLTKYMKEWINQALGQRSKAERLADTTVGMFNWMTQGSKLTAQKIFKGDVNIPWDEIMNPKNFYRPYAARNSSSTLIGFQSLFRLGGSFASAFANATQYWVNTLPKLMETGDNPVAMGKLAVDSWRTAVRLWRYSQFGEKLLGARLTPEEIRIKGLIDEAGVALAPSKLAAGAGRPSGFDAGRPLYKGSKFEYAKDWADYIGLFMFNGAERTNRYGTAIAAMMKTLRKGGSDSDAIAAARRLVRETQFSYDELSIPSAMSSFGPLGRVLFQFKPFLVNQLSYEKDLILGALGRKDMSALTGLTQLLTHYAGLGAFGGLAGILYNPAVALIGNTVKLVTGNDLLTAQGASRRQSEKRDMLATPEERFMHTMNYQGDDLLYYGLPGLLHLNMGQRVGVSGQDVLNSFDTLNNVAGPSIGMFGDYWNLWKAYIQQTTPSERVRAVGGAAAGVGAATLAGGGALSKVAGGLVGTWLASLGTHNTFKQFITGAEGHQITHGRAAPTAFRNFLRSALLFQDGIFVDIDGKPEHVPLEGRNQEVLYAFLGLPTVRRTEYQTMESILLANAEDDALQRKTMIDQIARAWADGDYEKAYDAIYRAQDAGINIEESAVQRRIQALTREQLETLRSRVPMENRIIMGGGTGEEQ